MAQTARRVFPRPSSVRSHRFARFAENSILRRCAFSRLHDLIDNFQRTPCTSWDTSGTNNIQKNAEFSKFSLLCSLCPYFLYSLEECKFILITAYYRHQTNQLKTTPVIHVTCLLRISASAYTSQRKSSEAHCLACSRSDDILHHEKCFCGSEKH